ncbi:MAG: DUF1810 family protein, partial [Candidatus Margulisbacteria bacterium]|nr:DUF1810 family protein [Candidatus Margulisiibacteriota bacterium]
NEETFKAYPPESPDAAAGAGAQPQGSAAAGSAAVQQNPTPADAGAQQSSDKEAVPKDMSLAMLFLFEISAKKTVVDFLTQDNGGQVLINKIVEDFGVASGNRFDDSSKTKAFGRLMSAMSNLIRGDLDELEGLNQVEVKAAKENLNEWFLKNQDDSFVKDNKIQGFLRKWVFRSDDGVTGDEVTDDLQTFLTIQDVLKLLKAEKNDRSDIYNGALAASMNGVGSSAVRAEQSRVDTSSDPEIAEVLLDPRNVGSRDFFAQQSRVDTLSDEALAEQEYGGPGGHPDTSSDEALARKLARQEYGGPGGHAGPAAGAQQGAQQADPYPLQQHGGDLDRKAIEKMEQQTLQRDNDITMAQGTLDSLNTLGDASDQNKAAKATLDILTAQRDGHEEKKVKNKPNNANVALNEINGGKKEGHWIWYVLPQHVDVAGTFGFPSPENNTFGVRSLQHAKDLMGYPSFRENYEAMVDAISTKLSSDQGNHTLKSLFGGDDVKVRSSITLFSKALEGSDQGKDKALLKKMEILKKLVENTTDQNSFDCPITLAIIQSEQSSGGAPAAAQDAPAAQAEPAAQAAVKVSPVAKKQQIFIGNTSISIIDSDFAEGVENRLITGAVVNPANNEGHGGSGLEAVILDYIRGNAKNDGKTPVTDNSKYNALIDVASDELHNADRSIERMPGYRIPTGYAVMVSLGDYYNGVARPENTNGLTHIIAAVGPAFPAGSISDENSKLIELSLAYYHALFRVSEHNETNPNHPITNITFPIMSGGVFKGSATFEQLGRAAKQGIKMFFDQFTESEINVQINVFKGDEEQFLKGLRDDQSAGPATPAAA